MDCNALDLNDPILFDHHMQSSDWFVTTGNDDTTTSTKRMLLVDAEAAGKVASAPPLSPLRTYQQQQQEPLLVVTPSSPLRLTVVSPANDLTYAEYQNTLDALGVPQLLHEGTESAAPATAATATTPLAAHWAIGNHAAEESTIQTTTNHQTHQIHDAPQVLVVFPGGRQHHEAATATTRGISWSHLTLQTRTELLNLARTASTIPEASLASANLGAVVPQDVPQQPQHHHPHRGKRRNSAAATAANVVATPKSKRRPTNRAKKAEAATGNRGKQTPTVQTDAAVAATVDVVPATHVNNDCNSDDTHPNVNTKLIHERNIRLTDVLCERGGKSNNHDGNQEYLRLVEERKSTYQAPGQDRTTKREMGDAVLQAVRRTGGRFIERTEDGEERYEEYKKELDSGVKVDKDGNSKPLSPKDRKERTMFVLEWKALTSFVVFNAQNKALWYISSDARVREKVAQALRNKPRDSKDRKRKADRPETILEIVTDDDTW